ncbi:MAG: YlmC/YmxH family sporulation protein [Ruminococcaceae bacterium]|nr:YlmC/YmxH family sporulation protein [Oscillospiraceae bacterium]
MSGNRNTECTQSGCRQVALPGCSINELKEKEVINISDGARLGFICDIEADLYTGRIIAVIIPLQTGILGFSSKKETIRVCWEQIERIGDDIILVKLHPSEAEKLKKATQCKDKNK